MTLVLIGVIVMLFSGCTKEPVELTAANGDKVSQVIATAVTQNGHEYVPNEMLVRFKPGTSESARLIALSKVNGSVAENKSEMLSKIQNDPYAIGFCKVNDILDLNGQVFIDDVKLLPID